MSMEKSEIKAKNKIWLVISVICFYLFKALMKLTKRELTFESYNAFMQFVKFGIVGVSNTLISYLIYAGTLYLLEMKGWFLKADYIIASVLSFVLSVLWSFFWNSKKVFTVEEGEHRAWFPALIKTFIAYSFSGLFLSNILLFVWVQVLGVSKYLAPLINLIITIPLNFVINKFWAFRTKKSKNY